MTQIEKADRINNLNNDNNFFTKKRIFIFLSLTIFMIIFSVLISVFALKIDINEINNYFINAFNTNNLFGVGIFLLFLFPSYVFFSRFIVLYIRVKKEGVKAKGGDGAIFTFIGSFLNAVTPFSTGNEPYTLYGLKTQGLETKKALLILSSIGIFNPFVQIIITGPSFFIISSQYSSYSHELEGLIIYGISFAGLIFDLIAFLSFFALVYSRRIHYFLNSSYYGIRKKFHLSYKTKEEIKNKYIDKATFKKEFIEEVNDYKFYSFYVITVIIGNVIYYSSVYFAYQLSPLQETLPIEFHNWFNYTNIATTANNGVPIGGAEGTLQVSIIAFLSSLNPMASNEFKGDIVTIIFIGRLFNFYIPAIIGMVCFPIAIFQVFRRYKN